MSWNPFKKAFSGRRTRSEDVDFEKEIDKLRQMQAISKRMYKNMKKCNELETSCLRSKQHLANDVKSSPLTRTEPLKFVGETLGCIIQSLHAYSRDLKANHDAVFVDPIKRLNNVYKQVELYAKQREQKLQEYERQQIKLEKQGRKSSSSSQYQQQQTGNQSKIELSQRAVTTAHADYERVHDRLMMEIPQLLEGRLGYFDVCLCAVMKAQALYYNECSACILTGLESLLDDDTDEIAKNLKSEERIQQSTSFCLASIRTLSIVGNPQAY